MASHDRNRRSLGCAQLKVYKGLPHGMASTHHDVINADLLAFIKS